MRRGCAVLLALALAAGGCGRSQPPTVDPPDAVLGALAVYDLGAPAPAAPDVGTLYFTLVNAAADPDTLLAIATPDGMATLHAVVTEGGASRMRHLPALPVPAGETVRLRPGGYHVMIDGLTRRWVPGDTVPFTLTFARAGTLTVRAPVRTYTEVIERLDRREDRRP